MKLYSDKGNINTIKVLIAAEIESKNLELLLAKPEEKFVVGDRLPVLKLASGVQIFSPNVAARYLLESYGDQKSDDFTSITDQWLEWESTQLQPLIHKLCTSTVSPGNVESSLKKLLNHLDNTTRNNSNSLTGADLSVADIVIWCCLYPLACKDSPFSGYIPGFTHLQNWFCRIQQLPAVSKALGQLSELTFKEIKTSLQTQTMFYQIPNNPQSAATSQEGDVGVSLPSVSAEMAKEAEKAWNSGIESVPQPRESKGIILPKDGERNILVTSALPYVNNVPHLGNIIGCVLSADAFARFCRLRNLNTLYICGTDEYGTATETKAMEEGVTPQEICDKYNKLHTQIYEWFDISFDYFGRTTTQAQTDIAQDIFWKLYHNGYIIKDSVEQLQCEQCNRFLADRFVEGICPFCAYEDARGDQCDKCGKLINAIELKEPRCKQCGKTPVVKISQHLFMDLPKLQPLLDEHLAANFDKGIFTQNAKVITKSWLRDGLKPRCISRDLKWGTPVPLEGYTDKVFYVWYDAPIGYISITANYTDQWKQWWQNPEKVELFNFMAKDNVPFHTVIFPSTLLGTKDNWTVVNNLSATEYLNYENGKFSKSRGVGVFGNDAFDTGIPADVWRFYLLFLRPETQDSVFSWDDFMLKNNSELLNNLGNFINRALMFVSNNFDSCIPAMNIQSEDAELLALVTKELNSYIEHLSNIRLRDGIRNILTISRYGNQYIQAHKPWVMVKGTEDDKVRAGTVVGLAANIACLLSVLVQPYMPQISRTIQKQLNAPATCNIINRQFVPYLTPGHRIGKPSPLFQKIEASTIKELKKRFAGQQQPPQNATIAVGDKETITKLEKAVTEQGNVVRRMKAEKTDKSELDAAITKLLDLKRQLAVAQGLDPDSVVSGGKKNKKKK